MLKIQCHGLSILLVFLSCCFATELFATHGKKKEDISRGIKWVGKTFYEPITKITIFEGVN